MTETQYDQIVKISKQLEKLLSAKTTIKENSDVYLSICYRPDFLTSYGNVKVFQFLPERLKIAEQWIDEDIQRLQEELKNL